MGLGGQRVRWTGSWLAAVAMLGGCALPPNAALPDWARSASVLAGQATQPVDPDGRQAALQALAVYLYALGVVAEERVLTFRETPFAALAPRAAATSLGAGDAVAGLGAVLRTAREANPDPEARANSAGQPRVIENLRLRPMILAADPHVQRLVAMLAGADTAAPERRALASIGEGHALLAARARSVVRLGQRATAIEIRAAEEALLRAGARLPPGAAGAAGVIAATVQP